MVLTARWHTTNLNGCQGLDKPIIPLCRALAKLPGIVVPVWSCSSHPKVDTRMYLSMAMDLKGFHSIKALNKLTKSMANSSKFKVPRHICRSVNFELTELLNLGFDSYADHDASWSGISLYLIFDDDQYHTDKVIDKVVDWLIFNIERVAESENMREKEIVSLSV